MVAMKRQQCHFWLVVGIFLIDIHQILATHHLNRQTSIHNNIGGVSSTPRQKFFVPSSTVLPNNNHALLVRGGAQNISSKRNNKATKSSRSNSSGKKKKRKEQIGNVANENDNSKARSSSTTTTKSSQLASNESFEQSLLLPTVQSLLVPRRMSLSILIRWVAMIFFVISLFHCIQTAGMPYTNAVFQLIYGNQGIASSTNRIISDFDEVLAHKLASSTNDILPPRFLPSSIPLLGLLASVGLGVGMTVLFPQWFIQLRVFYDYKQYHNPGKDATTTKMLQSALSLSRTNNKKTRSNNTKKNSLHSSTEATGACVLVSVPREQQDFESDGKALVVRPLYKSESSPTAKDDDNKDIIVSCHAHPYPYFFELNHRRIYCDPFNPKQQQQPRSIDGSPTLHTNTPLRDLLSTDVTSGLCTPSRLSLATERFGPYASLSLPTPTVQAAFFERISSPLVALQMMGRLLNVLEENIFSSLLGLFQTLVHHYWNARRSIVSAQELAQEVKGNVEDTGAMEVWALRPKKENATKMKKKKSKRTALHWVQISAVDLLPGDVFVLGSLTSRSQELVMPVDALLMEGDCIANEAVLTGESVPQSKIPIDVDLEGDSASGNLDMMTLHRNSVLFAGTSLLRCANQDNIAEENSQHPPLPKKLIRGGKNCAKFLTLRTGSYSSRGELMRALARSSGRVGAISNEHTEKDALRLIVSLSLFALVACASLFIPSLTIGGGAGVDKPRKEASPFRRVIQCSRIAIASIPSDIPLALSSVAQSCSMKLRQDADVVCSEPGSLLTSAYVDMVVFDKTGTLTADTQSLSFLVPPSQKVSEKGTYDMTDAVLGGCHSLISLGKNNLVGDPLDLASLKYSGWIYDSKEDCYTRKGKLKGKSSKTTSTTKLWQVKTFPFDPSRRMSSALILVRHEDGSYRLWKVVKGSPDTLQKSVTASGSDSKAFDRWYSQKVQKLEDDGFRTIALSAKDMTEDTSLLDVLFPNGVPQNEIDMNNTLASARHAARNLHRDSLEPCSDDAVKSFNFVGFACFDASLRPSTLRVINGIKSAGVKAMMLTGDGVDAAISVGRKAGLLNSDTIAVLDVDHDTVEADLVLKTISQISKKKTRSKGKKTVSTQKFSSKTLKTILEQVVRGDCTIAATGSAVEKILSTESDGHEAFRKNLFRLSIIARASPRVKKSVVTNLREKCGSNVLMCGDGVNDVAAMKAADAAVALLNGYGDETITTDISNDIEDDRRRQKLKEKRIGKNRASSRSSMKLKDDLRSAGIGESAAASRARVKAKMDEAILEVHQAAALRNGDGQQPNFSFQDIKDLSKAVFNVYREERERAKQLRKGGGGAARVLAEEDRMRKLALKGKDTSTDDVLMHDDENDCALAIKPGEASLAAPFSCLRPAIDGVDALMRAGVATAACSLAMQQTIALNCLMSCYNLATLYRDNFRYGPKMFNFEFFFYMAIDQASYAASCTPRPKLTGTRPVKSMFDLSSAFSILAQAGIHLMTLTSGVKFANQLEHQHSVLKSNVPKIKWKKHHGVGPKHQTIMELLVAGLARTTTDDETEDKSKRSVFNIFGRPPFRPNYTTNIVFLLSIFQNAATTIVNHKGKPFCGSILESRQMCMAIAACLAFVGACVFEAIPMLNDFLDLRHLPELSFRLRLWSLFVVDFVGCFMADRFSSFIGNYGKYKDKEKIDYTIHTGNTAADEEEELLTEESKQNRKILLAAVMFNVVLLIKNLSVST